MRFPYVVLLSACVLTLALPLIAQSPNGVLNGLVVDPANAAIVGADVRAINDATGVQYATKTNGEGIYVLPNLPPGPYRLQVAKFGFKTIVKPDIMVHLQDALALNFTLPIGATAEVVTVTGGTPLVNTENGAVSTVVDRSYVANMPLNGRSFQDLIRLTPGVVTNSPQGAAFLGNQGEFSVNGQRTESNYYTVDGVSANVGVDSGTPISVSNSGSLPVSTVLGTTQGLVSTEAMEEFRVQTSTYSAELGRNPGGQFSFATRSGTNVWSGTLFEYLRNDIFDANDWFNNYRGERKAALRQNDFGGTIGGPVTIPGMYKGRDRTFFFFSYEGLRLVQPQASSITPVPAASLREETPSPLRQVMDAFPVANGPDFLDPTGAPTGLAQFSSSWSVPSQLDSYSIRLDHTASEHLRFFARFADTPSSSRPRYGGNSRNPSNSFVSNLAARSITGGATVFLSRGMTSDFRINYTSNEWKASTQLDSFGGAKPVDLIQLQGLDATGQVQPNVAVGLAFSSYLAYAYQSASVGRQHQLNLVHTVGLSIGTHQFKLGWDFRRLTPDQFTPSPGVTYYFLSPDSVRTNSVDLGFAQTFSSAFPHYNNFSAFTQDAWNVAPRLSVSMGLRWEVNPAPSAARGNLPYTAHGDSLSTLALAPQGTPLWNTTWFNFAPRLGVAYLLRNAPDRELVLRGGVGVFFDTGQQLGSYGYNGPGFSANTSFGGLLGSPASFPIPAAEASPPILNPPVAPYTSGVVYAFAPHLQLPFTLEWNVSLEQALGKSMALTGSYVGSNSRRLLQINQTQVGQFNPDFGTVDFMRNGLTADYEALQVQFQRRLTHGLQSLASYTWGHSIDYGSTNASLPYRRGNSDFDVQHNFSGALSYEFSNGPGKGLGRSVVRGLAIDTRFSGRTGFPVTLNGNSVVDPSTGQVVFGGLDRVPTQPVYVYGSQYPGGRSINPAAFAVPPSNQAGNAARNFARGFEAWQLDLAIRKDIPVREKLKLQFRAEAFNILNHTNFGAINANYCSGGTGCTFGQATSTLANSLSVLSPLYQMGGPRSMQFAVKMFF
jgi:hypothetical protein